MQTQTGDDLIARVLAHANDDDVLGPAANDLLEEVFAGYPVDNLRRLLRSDDEKVVRTGAWLLSELGELAAPLADELPALLASPLRQARFFAVEAVLNAGDADGPLAAQALALVRDGDDAVRWKVLSFLAEAGTEQLAAGAEALADAELKELTEWLVRLDGEEVDPREVVALLEGDDRTARMFAAGAAARLSHEEDTNLLAHAATAEDEEIRSFALERLDDLR
ncbi:hypothetical protein Nocox_40470 [Nonomuraea coxensis DSM 45129]|uniref:HEAT repeat domain-containing protein n=1 Tax=Nonomuraea coxensis DSM 45129 TaxID=1122611 RepID=A0ABX8UD64_9ACTN|nr:hypothetical protein [Nonomuraea coxensis]QYC45637.1 hypothetical protein Nocox_40470 [Nonomuraea coxensis DSM 45129]